MPEAIYLLCAITSLASAGLLLRMWRQRRSQLLLWSSLCFVGLAINNAVLVIDLLVVPDVDLMMWRTAAALASAVLLVFGLVWAS